MWSKFTVEALNHGMLLHLILWFINKLPNTSTNVIIFARERTVSNIIICINVVDIEINIL